MLSAAANRDCPVLWALKQTQTHVWVWSYRVCISIIGSAGRGMLTHGIRLHMNAHRATHKNTRCGYVVSPAAAQLIWTLTTQLPPPHHAPQASPIPEGSHSGAGQSHPQVWAASQQLELRPGDTWGANEKSEKRIYYGRKKKKWMWNAREWRKGGEEVSGGYLSHSLSYTKFPSVPVILETEAGLKSKHLCADGDEAMVTEDTLWPLYESLRGVCWVTFQCKLNILNRLLLELWCRHTSIPTNGQKSKSKSTRRVYLCFLIFFFNNSEVSLFYFL